MENSAKNFAGLETQKASKKKLLNGGQAEIRTQERSRVAGFQDRCIQPLCHLSALYVCHYTVSFLFVKREF